MDANADIHSSEEELDLIKRTGANMNMIMINISAVRITMEILIRKDEKIE